MNQRNVQACTRLVAGELVPGERVELAELAGIGKVSVKRQLGVAAAAAVLSAGTVVASARPRVYCLIVTNRRLFLADYVNGRVGRTIVAAVPRAAVSAGPLRGHLLTLSMDVTIDGVAHRFGWGRLIPGTAAAKRVAASLGTPATA